MSLASWLSGHHGLHPAHAQWPLRSRVSPSQAVCVDSAIHCHPLQRLAVALLQWLHISQAKPNKRWFVRTVVGDESQQTANWNPDMCSPVVEHVLQQPHGCNGRASPLVTWPASVFISSPFAAAVRQHCAARGALIADTSAGPAPLTHQSIPRTSCAHSAQRLGTFALGVVF